MLTQFIASTFKTLNSNKTLVLLNVSGLGITLCVVFLVYVYANTEYSYDGQWENADRIVRLNKQLRPESLDPVNIALTSYLMMPGLREFFSDSIELSARRVYRAGTVLVDEKSYEAAIEHYEKEIIDIFQFDVIRGSLESTMASPGKLALSTQLSRKYFGSKDPLGQVISLDVPELGLVDYVVSAVYRIPEGKSALDFPSKSTG